MATGDEQSASAQFHRWVQTIGIMIAAAWGIYTFVYKEIMLPKAAPINITVDLQLKKIGMSKSDAAQEKNALIAVEMRIAATNPSSREVYLLPSAWIAYGVKINASSGDSQFQQQVAAAPVLEQASQLERHASASEATVVAVGSLLSDVVLKPNETSKRTLLFHVPRGRYDHLELEAVMPTMGKQSQADLEWKFDQKTQSLAPIMYRVGRNGERTKMQEDKRGGYSDPILELQMARSRQALSLWE
jgi:hypothetical protein